MAHSATHREKAFETPKNSLAADAEQGEKIAIQWTVPIPPGITRTESQGLLSATCIVSHF